MWHSRLKSAIFLLVRAPMTIKKLLKAKDVAQSLGISIRHAYRLIASGEIPSVHISTGAVRVTDYDLEEYIELRRKEDYHIYQR